ncbi:hypothetical protein CRP01_00730 [Flavilitoribacter nigricans DSM 23189 = NBRC 102662]|uniref:Uncharacterized protein n=2 Tax=Flavilitoribacter TaxID=2762562 RepID=A0A2D0NJ00_FLAN2|nr:hypothetical protein CRP01_00730 [Flavilitoribacter nigricans DSM 23189 = NBRC 102662]
MISKIEPTFQEYKTALDSIAGGHSFAIVVWGFEGKIRSIVELIEEEMPTKYPESKIPWLDFKKAIQTYGEVPKRKKLTFDEAKHALRKQMEEAWYFQKMFNLSQGDEYPEVEAAITQSITATETLLQQMDIAPIACEEIYFDLGANDYWAIVISWPEGAEMFEFLHFID